MYNNNLVKNTEKIFICCMITIATTIIITSISMTTPMAKKTMAQTTPHITITEALASNGYQNNGIFNLGKRLFQGDTVFQGQYIQFREDFNHNTKIVHVYCAIDGNYVYRSKCSTPFEGKTYGWILNAGISTNNLRDGPHTFSVLIDTDEGRTNTVIFGFKLTHSVCFDGPVVNGRCR